MLDEGKHGKNPIKFMLINTEEKEMMFKDLKNKKTVAARVVMRYQLQKDKKPKVLGQRANSKEV